MTYHHNNKDPNLNNLHHAMVYRDGEPHVRVDLGSDNITITGDVNILDNIRVNNTEEQSIPVHLTDDPIGVTQSTSPWVISKDTNTNASTNPIYVNFTNGTIGVTGTFWQTTQPVSIATMPTTPVTGTFWQATQPVSIATMPSTPVTGTFWQTTQPVSGTVTIQDGGNTITVDGTVTANVTFPDIQKISATAAANTALNPLYIAGNVSTIGGSAQGKLWTMQVAQGLIAGHTIEQVTGYNPSTSAGDAVWSGGTAYPWSSFATAQTLYLKSSTNNATDRSMSILIDGLDANYANQTEVITLNASDSRTAVATTKQFLRIHNIQCNGADTNVGDIITTVTSGTGTVVSKISAGRGSARAGCFTIPAGYTGYLFKGDASSTAATVVNFMARYYGKAFMVVHVAIVDNSTYIYDFPFPMPLPEKTDMYCTIEAGSGKTAVNYEILLVAN